MARLEGLGREGKDVVRSTATYAVRRWHMEGSENKHTDQVVEAPSPEDAARSVAASNGDKVTRRWGSYPALIPPVLFLIGCNSVDEPDTTSIEVYAQGATPPNWTGPSTDSPAPDTVG
jgi:hypothetical protein